MSVQLHESAHADLTVSVSRDAAGDLADGVSDRLAGADGVEAVEAVELHGLTPGLNDLTVEVEAELRVARDADVAAGLESCFGVDDVQLEGTRGSP